jgi:hypothetical protein
MEAATAMITRYFISRVSYASPNVLVIGICEVRSGQAAALYRNSSALVPAAATLQSTSSKEEK